MQRRFNRPDVISYRLFGILIAAAFAFTPGCLCHPEDDDPGNQISGNNNINPVPDPDPALDPCTDGTVVFEETFYRGNCGPKTETRDFTVPEDGEICVLLTNDGVSAAWIKLDGTKIFDENDFNPNVQDMSTTEPVGGGSHELKVRLVSAPGSSLNVQIRFAADGPPPPLCSDVARQWCLDRGWVVESEPDPPIGNIVCTSNGWQAGANCEGCADYNIVVWEDGSEEQFCPGQFFGGTYSTVAGNVYGGHSPCQCGDNLLHCGTWDMQGCVPD